MGALLSYFVAAWVSALSDILALQKEQLAPCVRSKSFSSLFVLHSCSASVLFVRPTVVCLSVYVSVCVYFRRLLGINQEEKRHREGGWKMCGEGWLDGG